jgi:hypothetical protein
VSQERARADDTARASSHGPDQGAYLHGETRIEKTFSLFEPTTEIIRKGKAAKPNEFGKPVKLQEAESQIVTDCEVYDRRPSDTMSQESRHGEC